MRESLERYSVKCLVNSLGILCGVIAGVNEYCLGYYIESSLLSDKNVRELLESKGMIAQVKGGSPGMKGLPV